MAYSRIVAPACGMNKKWHILANLSDFEDIPPPPPPPKKKHVNLKFSEWEYPKRIKKALCAGTM